MSKKASHFQKKVMSWGYRGKEIFKPLNTGRIDEYVACIREWVANIFFYTKNGTTIMIDAGYNYDRLREKMGWLNIDPVQIKHILITHQDTDHVGAVERDDDEHLFTGDTLWFGVDGGYSFINSLAEDNELAKKSLDSLEQKLRSRNLMPKIITGHTGWTDDLDFAFRYRDKVCNSLKKQKPHDPKAPYDGYDETDDTEEKARNVFLSKAN